MRPQRRIELESQKAEMLSSMIESYNSVHRAVIVFIN